VLRPTTGELLRAVHVELAAQVLPALPDGTPRRQLKAALHLLRRLERSWDRQAPYLEADNADLARTLDETLRALPGGGGYASLRGRLAALGHRPSEPPPADDGVTDRGLRRLMAANHALQEILADLHAALRTDRGLEPDARQRATSVLGALHRRLLDRAGTAAGNRDDR
jgi:hypothetical protein